MPNERLVLQADLVVSGAAQADAASLSVQRLIDVSQRSGVAGARAGQQIGDSFSHAVPQMGAASAAVRALEGNIQNNVRAAERFLTTTLGLGPALQAAFPVVGAIAFGGAIIEAGKSLYGLVEKFDPIADAQKRATDGAKEYSQSIKSIREEIAKIDFSKFALLNGKTAGAFYQPTVSFERLITRDQQVLAQAKGEYDRALQTVSEHTIQHGNSGGMGGNIDRYGLAAKKRTDLGGDLQLALHDAEVHLSEDKQAQSEALRQANFDQRQKQMDASQALADKAKQLHEEVAGYAKSAREYGLGPVSLAYQKRDEMLAKPGLTAKDRATVNEAGALEIARALAKIAEEESRLRPLTFKSDLSTILSSGGAGIDKENSEAARTVLRDATRMVEESRATIRSSDRDAIEANATRASQAIQRLSIGARPEDAARIANETLAIRNRQFDADRAILATDIAAYGTAQQRAELARLQGDLDDKAYEASEQHFRSMQEIVQRQQDQVRSVAGSFLQAAFGGNRGISSFVKSNAERFATGAFENLAGHYAKQITGDGTAAHPGLIPHAKDKSFIGMLLKGLPGGPDPMKGAVDPLKLATTDNTTETRLNTSVLRQLDSRLATMGFGASGSGQSGGSYLGIPASDLYRAIVGLPPGITVNSTIPGAGDWPALSDPMAGLINLPPAVKSGLSAATKIAAGIGIAGGGLAAYQGFSNGGARGALEGSAGVLGAATSALSLAKGIASDIPVIGAVATTVLGLVGSFLPDPRQKRANAINKELTEAIYHAPTAINKTVSTDGTYMDRDSMGNLRGSAFSGNPITTNPYTYWGPYNTPYQVPGSTVSPFSPAAPTIIINHNYQPGAIQTMDAGSFHDFAQQNHEAIGAAAATNLGSGHTALAQRIQYLQR